MKITQFKFPLEQYYQTGHKKVQIYLHHTAGNSDPYGVYKDWETNKDRIGTCVVIGGLPDSTRKWEDGEVIQGYSSKLWASHLGVKGTTFKKYNIPYQDLNEISIGIEICNWGGLTLKNDKFYNYVNKEVPITEVCTLNVPFKGFKYFHMYTNSQIQSVKELMILWKEKYGIPLTYNSDIWDITTRALKGEPGVYTHNSVREDKIDIYPDNRIIKMLESL